MLRDSPHTCFTHTVRSSCFLSSCFAHLTCEWWLLSNSTASAHNAKKSTRFAEFIQNEIENESGAKCELLGEATAAPVLCAGGNSACEMGPKACPGMAGAPVQVAASPAPAGPAGKTYCCGSKGSPACSGPDWTPIAFKFDAAATTAAVSITIDSNATACKAEQSAVAGTKVTFPQLASKTDCLGQMLRATGALTSDLVVTYNAAKDTLEVAVDSEGVDETIEVCK